MQQIKTITIDYLISKNQTQSKIWMTKSVLRSHEFVALQKPTRKRSNIYIIIPYIEAPPAEDDSELVIVLIRCLTQQKNINYLKQAVEVINSENHKRRASPTRHTENKSQNKDLK